MAWMSGQFCFLLAFWSYSTVPHEMSPQCWHIVGSINKTSPISSTLASCVASHSPTPTQILLALRARK